LAAQLLQDAFKHLAERADDSGLGRLQRLADMYPNDAFFAMAQAHERQRLALARVNVLLAAGRVADADGFVAQQLGSGQPTPALVEAKVLTAQLAALNDYVACRPFPASEEMLAAMDRLRQQQSRTSSSPAFAAWWAEQEAALVRLQVRERAVAASQLLQAADLAAVQEDPELWTILAHLRCLDPANPGLAAIESCLAGDWAAVVPGRGGAGATAIHATGLEIGGLLCWARLPAAPRTAFRQYLQRNGPACLSGVLLQALLVGAEGQVAPCLDLLRGIAATTPVGPAACRDLMGILGLPASQFAAACWQPAAPSVPDLLRRVQQFRTQPGRDTGGGR
jgi:hypothetical protein